MQAVSAEMNLDRLLQLIMAKASEVLGADRSTLFLLDARRGELWSKVAQGAGLREIRLPVGQGIAGAVAATGETVNIPDAYADPRFNPEVDRRTGYRTRTILCMPVRNREQRLIGVIQALNKQGGPFTREDGALLQALLSQAAIALENAGLVAELERRVAMTEKLLAVMRAVSAEMNLDGLLQVIMAKTSEVLGADRSTLFLREARRNELWSKVAQGMTLQEIRLPVGQGIAGHVAATGETVNIPDAYADPRFNPEVDRRTGYRTRTILCVPMRDEAGTIAGVAQVLNKLEGAFTAEDEALLGALLSQVCISLKNAKLFDEVLYMKNYNEGILESMASGVITTDDEGRVTTVNRGGRRMFALGDREVAGLPLPDLLGPGNPGILEAAERVRATGERVAAYDLPYVSLAGEAGKLNLHALPLRDAKGHPLGSVMVGDDITQEQRLMTTLCRMVSREVAERVLRDKELRLGGTREEVTILFTDIRDFTTLSERYAAEEIVSLLNEYFGLMIDPILRHEGTLDKFIGDAIMAVFGAPVRHEDDPLRAVRAALDMRRALREFNRRRAAAGKPTIETGIGISTGEAVAGNIGSEQRLEFTVIGDTVNTSSRLEGLTKQHAPYRIIITRPVYEAVRGEVACVPLGAEQVKGKQETLELFGIPDPPER
jgi:adenylate cyclase